MDISDLNSVVFMIGNKMKPSQFFIVLMMLFFHACTKPSATYSESYHANGSQPILPLMVSFADTQWGGQLVPYAQRCQKDGGHGISPALRIQQIPSQANAIIVEFSDRSSLFFNHGGLGVLGLKIKPGQKIAKMPSIEENDFTLPNDVFIVKKHRSLFPWRKRHVYLPPCSGEKKHDYFATIKAVNLTDGAHSFDIISQTEIYLGQY